MLSEVFLEFRQSSLALCVDCSKKRREITLNSWSVNLSLFQKILPIILLSPSFEDSSLRVVCESNIESEKRVTKKRALVGS